MVTKKLDYLKNRNKARYERKRKAEPSYEKPCSIGFFLYEDKDFIFMQTSLLNTNPNEIDILSGWTAPPRIKLGITRQLDPYIGLSHVAISRTGLVFNVTNKKQSGSLYQKHSKRYHVLLKGLYWIKRFNTGEFK